jgi:two-component system nitrate/nitrite response regulator NarL
MGAIAGKIKDIDPLSRVARLSRREREVFDYVIVGATNREMAKMLDISVKTVETHRARINRKLGTTSTPTTILFAVKHGLLTPEMLP